MMNLTSESAAFSTWQSLKLCAVDTELRFDPSVKRDLLPTLTEPHLTSRPFHRWALALTRTREDYIMSWWTTFELRCVYRECESWDERIKQSLRGLCCLIVCLFVCVCVCVAVRLKAVSVWSTWPHSSSAMILLLNIWCIQYSGHFWWGLLSLENICWLNSQ